MGRRRRVAEEEAMARGAGTARRLCAAEGPGAARAVAARDAILRFSRRAAGFRTRRYSRARRWPGPDRSIDRAQRVGVRGRAGACVERRVVVVARDVRPSPVIRESGGLRSRMAGSIA